MVDRSSEAAQEYTLTVDGYSSSGWSEVSVPDQDIVTGSHTPGGAAGSIVTVGQVRETGIFTLTKQYKHSEFVALERRQGRDGNLAGARVDGDGRILNSYRPSTGVLKGITRGGKNAASGAPLLMMARFEADG